MKTIKQKPLFFVTIIYICCYVFRIMEYFIIRTDQSIIGEAFIHKLLGLALMLLVLWKSDMRIADIGFVGRGIFQYLCAGIGLGVSVFLLGYGVEILFCMSQGTFRSLDFYVTSYAVDKNVGMNTAFLFFVICILGNIINVLMEEGVFRGLFQKLLEKRYFFFCSALFASVLFGLWHTIGPVRNYVDGISSLQGTVANVLMLGITSGLIGFKFAMLSRMESALYMGMGDHFVNNTIVNLLHVTTGSGVDEMMFFRITVAQTVSFLLVLFFYLKKYRGKKHRGEGHDYQKRKNPGVIGA